MTSNIIMPALGFDMVEGTIVKWLKQEGEHVEAGEPVMEIETGKAVVPVEATASGVIAKIEVPAGQTVAVNTVVATMEVSEPALP